MRIVILQDHLRLGGTESQTLELFRRWNRSGVEVFLIVYRPGGQLAARLLGMDGTWTVLQNRDYHLNWLAPGLGAELRRLNPDAVLMMGRNGHRYGGWIEKAFPGIVRVATFRTRRTLPPSYRRALVRADRVIANSEAGRERLLGMEIGVNPGRIVVVPNGLLRPPPEDESAREASRVEARRRLGYAEGQRVLLYLGSFVPGKRVDWLLETLHGMEGDWVLRLVGDGPRRPGLASKWRGRDGRFHFVGREVDPADSLAGADLMVSGSVEEGLPNALIEGQAWGLPVVAVRIEGVSEVIAGGRTGAVVEPEDAEGFRREVGRWLGAGEDVRRAAREWALRRFDPEVRATEMLDQVISAVKGRGNDGKA